MIDLQTIYQNDTFKEKIKIFKQKKEWNIFQEPFLQVTNNKCPYCEVNLPQNIDGRDMTSTIDHYRPQEYYPTLKKVYQNYILMCSDCNNAYKGNEFLIYKNNNIHKIEQQVTDKNEIKDEKTLIVNPIKDNIFDIFILKFRFTNKGKILELYPKYSKSDNSYLYIKAKETINLFALGDCDKFDNSKEYNRCRVTLLKQHFNLFYDFIEALIEKNKEKAYQIMQDKNLHKYGFIEFFKKNQFQVDI